MEWFNACGILQTILSVKVTLMLLQDGPWMILTPSVGIVMVGSQFRLDWGSISSLAMFSKVFQPQFVHP